MSKNEFLKKSIYGEARVRNLLAGILTIALALALVAYLFGGLMGIGREGGRVEISDFGQFTLSLALITGGIFALGVYGGLEIGRYVEAEFGKRRKSLETPPPP